ncbi:sialate:O-sulfotransferase 2-like [Ruditapes philippinarum]|uniref:sialate:O-sulfotransferase 2-like n=1 Tax=Ruditapes philippinarum TaxID=129788 RepID=UPI00295BF9DC|nr:sialate:O-sulfotransferase 2-like [Ruditapes philippinarum]
MPNFNFIKCVLIFLLMAGFTENYNDGYIGCFLDKPDRILEVKFPDSEENNSYRCKDLCRVFRYKYSGTEFGKECFCGDKLKEYEKRAQTVNAKCHMYRKFG